MSLHSSPPGDGNSSQKLENGGFNQWGVNYEMQREVRRGTLIHSAILVFAKLKSAFVTISIYIHKRQVLRNAITSRIPSQNSCWSSMSVVGVCCDATNFYSVALGDCLREYTRRTAEASREIGGSTIERHLAQDARSGSSERTPRSCVQIRWNELIAISYQLAASY